MKATGFFAKQEQGRDYYTNEPIVLKPKKVYAAVRRCCDSGNEFTTLSTASYCPHIASDKATVEDSELVRYGRDNPVIRIGEFLLTEI